MFNACLSIGLMVERLIIFNDIFNFFSIFITDFKAITVPNPHPIKQISSPPLITSGFPKGKL